MSAFTGMNFNITTKDIPPALPNSLKRGIVTNRQVNPLNPDYQYLGARELKGANCNPFGNNYFEENRFNMDAKKESPSIVDKNENEKVEIYENEFKNNEEEYHEGDDNRDEYLPQIFNKLIYYIVK